MEFSSDEYFMREALRQARRALAADEVPIGAVVVREGEIIARAWNQVEMLKDATAHAEMLAITQAEAAVGDWRLTGCDLYVTKEPCPMCAGAIVHARLRRVIFGCPDPKCGGAGGMVNLLQMPELNHRCLTTSGIHVLQCGDPSGSGAGGPGFQFANEYPTDELDGPATSPVIYPRGSIAMANAGPDTNGSQFFLNYEDSPLAPDYTYFGQISEEGMATLDKVAEAGAEGGAADGAPAEEVRIETATVG